METLSIEVERARARELYRDYKRHLHYSRPIDRECMHAYQLIARGRTLIRALESIKEAGVKTGAVPDAGMPKLAICRADAMACSVRIDDTGACTMHAADTTPRHRGWRSRTPGDGPIQSCNVFYWPRESFATVKGRSWRATALVPTPPLNLRPRRGLANYHVLWEAEWTKVVPHDPMLLRRIGRADVWLVVAAWELTEVERAVLATRITV